MADVSEIPDVKVGDEVIIWDNINITLEELAKECNTINYEILSTVSERVPRVFIDKEE
jgi:alanine racemase